jgi:hypothetical protein
MGEQKSPTPDYAFNLVAGLGRFRRWFQLPKW